MTRERHGTGRVQIRRRGRVSAVVVGLASSLVLAACGSGSTSSTGTNGKSDIVLGMVGTDSGAIGAAIADVGVGAKAWVAAINAKGGLNGHQVKLVTGDDGGDVAKAVTLTRNMVQQDHVVAFIGSHTYALDSVLAYLKTKNVPIVGAVGGNAQNDQTPLIYTAQAASTAGMHSFALILKQQAPQVKKVGIIYCQEAPACLQQETGVKAYAEQQGFQVAYTGQASLAAPDFTAQVLAAKAAGVEAIYLTMDNPSSIRITNDAARQGWKPIFVGNSTIYNRNADAALAKLPPDIAFYAYSTAAPFGLAPGLKPYLDAVAKYEPGGDIGDNGTGSWTAGLLLEAIAPTFGNDVTSADITNGLLGLKNETLGGLTPPLTFNDGPHGDVNQCIVVLQYKNGWQAPMGPTQFVGTTPNCSR
jgi:branched-chain amino acid transport system substrate-binding protein